MQVLAQNATQLAVSNANNPEWDSAMFDQSAARAGERAIKGNSITRERRMINRARLISAVCADYRAHFAALYGKTDRLPSAVFELIEKAVDGYIAKTLALVNPVNAVSYNRGFYHDSREMRVTERVRLVGENEISLAEQHFGINLMINKAQKQIDNAPAAIDRDKLQAMKQHLMQLTVTRSFIEGEIKHQEELAKAKQ